MSDIRDELGREIERLTREVNEARLLLAAIHADLKMRAEIGTYDGDHDVQISDGIWMRLDAAVTGKGEAP